MRRMRHLRPREIQGCQLALDASIPTSLYDATSGGSLVAADGVVARWEDQSGNGYHATQADVNYRPFRRIAASGGCDGLEFGGANDVLVLSGGGLDVLRNVSSFAVVVTSSRDSLADATSRVTFARHTDYQWTIQHLVGTNAANKFRAGGRRLTADTADVTTQAGTSTSTNTVASDVLFGSHHRVYQNAILDTDDSSYLTAGSTANVASVGISIGGTMQPSPPTNTWDGKIYSVAVWGRNLGPVVVARMQAAQMRKWRING